MLRKLLGAVAAVVIVFGMSLACLADGGANPSDEALARLMDGNSRYVVGNLAAKDIGEKRRAELTGGQHPFATVITCSDSRVSPELMFDQGLGDIFVIRVAGNVVEPTSLGSIEYGVEHLHTPVLVLMGHQSCGAVTAALKSEGEPEGNIGAIINKILPAVVTVKAEEATEFDVMLERTIQANVRNLYDDVMLSPVIKELVHEGKLKIVLAEYYLDSGKVALMDGAASHADAEPVHEPAHAEEEPVHAE